MNSKELLIKDLIIGIVKADTTNIESLQTEIDKILSDYSITRLNTTLPSAGDKSGVVSKWLVEEFVKAKLAENCAQSTLKAYTLTLTKFYTFVKKDLNLIQRQDIVNYLTWYRCFSRDYVLSDNTVKNTYLNLSSFYNWLYINKYIAHNPMHGIATPKGNVPAKQVITPEEFERMVVTIERTKHGMTMARDIALIHLLIDTGIRVSECGNIKYGDVDLDQRRILVTCGKGNKQRMVYFSGKTKERLEEYLKYRPKIKQGDWLIANLKQENGKMNKSGIESVIRKLGIASDIPRIHPHLFRATFATNLIMRGTSPSVVQHLLGHADLKTLESYIQVSDRYLQKEIEKIYL